MFPMSTAMMLMNRPKQPGRKSAESMIYDELGTERSRGGGYDAAAGESRKRYTDLIEGGQGAFEESARAAVDAAMPSFRSELQGVRESANRRGVGVGDLGTSYEGDLASAFDRNMKNAISSQALGVYGTRLGASGDVYGMDVDLGESSRNRYLDLLTGTRDYEFAKANAKRKRRGGILGAFGTLLGGAAGFALGGPAGAAAGANIGGSFGSGIGG